MLSALGNTVATYDDGELGQANELHHEFVPTKSGYWIKDQLGSPDEVGSGARRNGGGMERRNNPMRFHDATGDTAQEIVVTADRIQEPANREQGFSADYVQLPPSLLTVPEFSGRVNLPRLPQSGAIDDNVLSATDLIGITKLATMPMILVLKTGGKKIVSQVASTGIVELMKAGNALDKGGLLTAVGRALQKHGSRPGSIFPKATGNVAAINAQGEVVLNGILTNPNVTSVIRHHARFGDVLEYRIPNGQGARFSGDGKTFIGFLE